MIADLLFKYWKENLKLTDDPMLFKVFLGIGLLIFSAGFCMLEFLSLRQHNLIGVIILLTAVIQYNKNTIISHITDPGKSSFCAAGKQTFRRFVLFQLLKGNVLMPVSVILTAAVSLVIVFFDPLMCLAVWVILAAELGVFLLSGHIAKQRAYHRTGGYVSRFAFHGTPGIFFCNFSFFLRQPLREYLEMLAELAAALLCVNYGMSPVVVNYFIIIFCVLDIELRADRNMERYPRSYGKAAFRKIAGVRPFSRFRSSDEYRIFLKYAVIELGFIYYGKWTILCFLTLLFALAFRYYRGYERVLEARTLFRNTTFRVCMFYFILAAIAPFLFEKEMYKLFAGYRQEYGILYFTLLSLILLLLPLERMIKITGEHVDEKSDQ